MKIWINDVRSLDFISGVYFLFSDERLIYIGTSCNLGQRLGDIRLIREYLKFGVITNIFYIECDEERSNLEKALIKMFRPVANISGLRDEYSQWKSIKFASQI